MDQIKEVAVPESEEARDNEHKQHSNQWTKATA